MLQIEELAIRAYEKKNNETSKIPELNDIYRRLHSLNPDVEVSKEQLATILDNGNLFYENDDEFKSSPIQEVW